uniref:Uncharacterized protein n=1 Tax=Anguilla anguilla TaxID=7936 RepID=A0A0E9RZ79_ANGAN
MTVSIMGLFTRSGASQLEEAAHLQPIHTAIKNPQVGCDLHGVTPPSLKRGRLSKRSLGCITEH